jgi:SET domain-containing protein
MHKALPHFQIYARIAVSEIHGVGVKAIRPIKKGTYIFYGDDDKIHWIKKSALRGLPKELMKLYKDFCIEKGAWYGCPGNFNKMTPAWYLNHSANPNVACDKGYRFYALRDIKKNEELTVDYRTYSGRRHRLTHKCTRFCQPGGCQNG